MPIHIHANALMLLLLSLVIIKSSAAIVIILIWVKMAWRKAMIWGAVLICVYIYAHIYIYIYIYMNRNSYIHTATHIQLRCFQQKHTTNRLIKTFIPAIVCLHCVERAQVCALSLLYASASLLTSLLNLVFLTQHSCISIKCA